MIIFFIAHIKILIENKSPFQFLRAIREGWKKPFLLTDSVKGSFATIPNFIGNIYNPIIVVESTSSLWEGRKRKKTQTGSDSFVFHNIKPVKVSIRKGRDIVIILRDYQVCLCVRVKIVVN